MDDLDEYERVGDLTRPYGPDKNQQRNQGDAEAMRAARCEVPRLSWDEYSAGAHCPGCGLPYRDEERWEFKGLMDLSDDERARYEREEARYASAHGECGAHRHSLSGSLTKHCGKCCPSPPLSPAQVTTISSLLGRKTPDNELMRWRLRLFCGHVVEKAAHYTHKTVLSAFMGGSSCPECGRDPSTIVDAEPIGLVASRAPNRDSAPVVKKKTRAQLEARVRELESQLEGRDDQAP